MAVSVHKELKERVSIANILYCKMLKFESGTFFLNLIDLDNQCFECKSSLLARDRKVYSNG